MSWTAPLAPRQLPRALLEEILNLKYLSRLTHPPPHLLAGTRRIFKLRAMATIPLSLVTRRFSRIVNLCENGVNSLARQLVGAEQHFTDP